MRSTLVTWSDRGVSGPAPSYITRRAAHDRGPVMRLMDQPESKDRYRAAWVLTIGRGEERARELCDELRGRVGRVELVTIPIDDPTDYRGLFNELGPVIRRIDAAHPTPRWTRDVCLSAGTPQTQTLWVILVQAGLFDARMLQVIPDAFVPDPHPSAIRPVHLDIEGFPEIRAMRDELDRLRATVRLHKNHSGRLIGDSPPMQELRERIARVAPTDLPVLVLGETGTGKELVARAIHDLGHRASGPFIAENCGAFTEGLLATELFGHEAGAFTGAAHTRRGLFEQAHGGTLFLDEIAEADPRTQAHLLRVLQDGIIRRVGGERPLKVDVRIIAATNKPLAQLVDSNDSAFREDLYYRLRGVVLELPPLRNRLEDLPALVDQFLAEHEASDNVVGTASPLRVQPTVWDALRAYPWPGNIRELRTEVNRWQAFCHHEVDGGDLSEELRRLPQDTPPMVRTSVANFSSPCTQESQTSTSETEERSSGDGNYPEVGPLAAIVGEVERRAISNALELCGHNFSQTARVLQIDRNTLKRKLKRYGLMRQNVLIIPTGKRR